MSENELTLNPEMVATTEYLMEFKEKEATYRFARQKNELTRRYVALSVLRV